LRIKALREGEVEEIQEFRFLEFGGGLMLTNYLITTCRGIVSVLSPGLSHFYINEES